MCDKYFNKEKYFDDVEYKFFNIKRYFKPNEKPIIYHYTNANALTNILKENEFFATNIEFMNDPLEIDYPIKLLKEVLAQFDESKENKLIVKYFHEFFIPKMEELSEL